MKHATFLLLSLVLFSTASATVNAFDNPRSCSALFRSDSITPEIKSLFTYSSRKGEFEFNRDQVGGDLYYAKASLDKDAIIELDLLLKDAFGRSSLRGRIL
ncbi:MAG: hypothetical protein R2827_00640 [Bdellovibrionales bacterium]